MKNKKNNLHGYKIFLQALEYAQDRPTKTKKCLEDKRLSSFEKRLLIFFLKIKENDFSMIEDIKNDVSFEAHSFFNGLRYYFLGMAYLYIGDAKSSEENYKKSIPLIGESNNITLVQRMTFKANANLFYAYVNTKRFAEMREQYITVHSLPTPEGEDKISLMLLDLCYFIVMEKYSEAKLSITQIKKSKSQMNSIQLMTFFIEEFDLLVKLDQFMDAQSVLNEMTKHRTFRLSANFKYMSLLLKFISKGERIYIYDKDFREHIDLYWMISIIKTLDESNYTLAAAYWNELEKISPEIFKKDFEYAGDKCLFSLALKKCLSKNAQKKISPSGIRYTPLEQTIINIIHSSPTGQMNKELLFFNLHGKEIESKADLDSLYAAIYRINKKGALTIRTKKGCYILEGTDQIAS